MNYLHLVLNILYKMDLFSGEYNERMNTFIEESISDSSKKYDKFTQIKNTLERSKSTIYWQNERIIYLYNSIIENHQDQETIKYVKSRLLYAPDNYGGTSLDDIYKDYIYWVKQIELPIRKGFRKDKRYEVFMNKKDFNEFLNSIFKPSEYGRDIKYTGYTGVSIKRRTYLEGSLEDELDGTLSNS